jgi:two-component system, LytTR family, response regulator
MCGHDETACVSELPDRISVVVCEDEPIARMHLRALVQATPRLHFAGDAADGVSAVALIDAQRPQLAFVDIRMPELDGLTVLSRVAHQPSVIFTTAFDAYAVQAFELGAVDYLLKPFGADRFATAVTRAVRHLESRAADGVSAADRIAPTGAPLTRLFARERGRIVPIVVSEIERLEAEDDYVAVFAKGRRHLLTVTLTSLLERLDAARFVRIHRSHAVNLDAIASMQAFDAGRLSVEMRDGTRITASRAGTQALRARTF